ncbi:hypothetical protein QFC19_007223 [Naganishia cerealis]|uniref:Uncharacterized protein n=1 Tax=Naganishia cerealis TaxID=610337 RepID=A0ACC2VAP6_9TREE|nr:hypothetical protein QFC19_007223 [Naganishia cerealis]
MSLTTNRQQELIEESISSALRYNDKVSQQYLRLRHDILELSRNSRNEESPKNDLCRVKVEQYRFELEKVYELYRIHVKSMQRIIFIHNNTRSLNLELLPGQLEIMTEQQNELKEQLRRLQDVQRPMLEKMKALSKSFDARLRPRGAKMLTQKIRKDDDGTSDPTSIDLDSSNFVFEEAEIQNIFKEKLFNAEIDWQHSVEEHLKGRLCRKLEHKYVYDVSRGTGYAAPASTTVEEYDRIISGLVEEIGSLLEHGQAAKERWLANAAAVDQLRKIRENEDR